MKVLVVTPTYYQQDGIIGGAERYVHAISKALSQCQEISDLKVVFFSPNQNSKTIFRHFSVFGYKSIYSSDNPSNPIPALSSLLIGDYDVLYLHQFNTWVTFFFVLFAKLKRKKVVLTDHNGGGINYNRRLGIDRFIDTFFATSNISVEDARLRSSETVKIYGGVNTDLFCEDSSVVRDKDFLFVGRYLSIKGIDQIIAASKATSNDHSLTLVLVVDDHSEKESILKSVGDNPRISVFFSLDQTKLRKLYQSHRWVLLPSKNARGRENLGLTILEGMACGAKGACSPYCGVGEMAHEYPTEDLQIIHDWNEFFKKETSKSSHESSSRKWVETHATWEQVASRIVSNLA